MKSSSFAMINELTYLGMDALKECNSCLVFDKSEFLVHRGKVNLSRESACVLEPTTGKVAGNVYEFLKLKIDLHVLLNSYPWLELTGGSDGNYEPSDNILSRLTQRWLWYDLKRFLGTHGKKRTEEKL